MRDLGSVVRQIAIRLTLGAFYLVLVGCQGVDSTPGGGPVTTAAQPATDSSEGQTTRLVLERYRAAAGDTAPSRVRSLRAVGTHNPPVGATFVLWFAAPNLAQRTDRYPGLAPTTMTFDGRDGWLAGPIKVVGSRAPGMSPAGWASLHLLHIQLLGLVPAALVDGGVVHPSYTGPSTAHGRPMECLAVTDSVSPTKELCFDAVTHLPATLMFEAAPIMPTDPPTRQLVRFREFVTVDALRLPSVVTHEWLNEGRVISTKRFERFVVNGEMDRGRFRRPDAAP
jgi:hypothetical protein